MVYNGGKKQELPPVRLPIKVAWGVSGAVRTLFLCAFGLRRNVLDVPGHAEFYVFGSVSPEGTDMELQGLAALNFLPETRGLVVDNEAACHHNKLNAHANITTSVMRRANGTMEPSSGHIGHTELQAAKPVVPVPQSWHGL